MARAKIAHAFAGSGVPQADMVLMISAQDTEACLSSSSTLAWAVPCQRDQHDRPVLGAVNFCPSAMNGISGPAREELQISTAQHEIAHALGFTEESIGLMRDRDTNSPRTARNSETGRPEKFNRVCSDGNTRSVEGPRVQLLHSRVLLSCVNFQQDTVS